jgi:cell division transport system permease protein
MLSRFRYFARETWINIRSNITFTLAAIFLVAVTASLVGAAFLSQPAVENATQKWQGGVEFIVYLDPQIPGAQRDSLFQTLSEHPDIVNVDFASQEQAYEEFRELFEDDLANNIEPRDLPAYFSVVPRDADPDLIDSLTAQFRGEPGVFRVESAKDTISSVTKLFSRFRTVSLWMSLFLLIAAVLLIYNSIRVAMAARRREIEVQKLVGATNWFIRFPFILEGMLHGFFGALLGAVGLQVLRNLVEDLFIEIQLFQNFIVSDSELLQVQIGLVIGGIIIGAVGSAFAAGRFLDV